jgi:FMN-dependent NADH-azoreductase
MLQTICPSYRLEHDMTTLLRVDSSIRTEGSVSRALADTAESAWLASNPSGVVVRRELGTTPLPSDAWRLAVEAGTTPEADRTPEQREAVALGATLADELVGADALLLAAPLYNFGVPAHLKTWIDMLVTDSRIRPGSTLLAGKPVLVVIARGGGYGEGTPRHGWDHSTAYLRRIFEDNFAMTVRITAAELTLAPVVPAMADLIGLSEQSLANAHVEAREHASRLADQAEFAA